MNSSAPWETLKVDDSCELVCTQIQVPGTNQLFVGSFYRPPDETDPDYLGQLNTYLSKILVGAHIWMGGDTDWETESIKPYASKPGLSNQLITIAKDNYLYQVNRQG